MKQFDAVACTVCGCVCDDLRITVEGGRITGCEGACHLAEPWFLDPERHRPPVALVEGQPVPLEAAVRRAAEILQAASSPLVYGLSRSSTEAQRAAVALCERIGGTIDTAASLCHASSVAAMQSVGECTCTLGEVRNRADLVIFWGSNPVETHPRHFERYSLTPPGRFTPRGRIDRTLVVADMTPTASAAQADIFLPVEPGRDFEALTTLRRLVRGTPVEPGSATGVSPDRLHDLAARMKACRYGVVFFGPGLSLGPLGQQNVEALLLLVRDLNDHTRFSVRGMSVPGDVTGADVVLTGLTGYPFSVNFARGYPRHNPGEFSAQNMLERGEVDVALFVGSEGIPRFSPPAIDHLRRIPTIVLDLAGVESPGAPSVRLTTAVYGIHRPGTTYRMDGVPIPLRAFLPTDCPSDDEILKMIDAEIGA